MIYRRDNSSKGMCKILIIFAECNQEDEQWQYIVV